MTSQSRKSRPTTAPSAWTATNRSHAVSWSSAAAAAAGLARGSLLALLGIAALAAYLTLTSTARGADLQLTSAEGKSLKWKAPRRSVSLPTRSADEPARLQLSIDAAPEIAPELGLIEASTADSADIIADGEVILLQALGQPASDPLSDPFGDGRPKPNVLPQVAPPATTPVVPAPSVLPTMPSTPAAPGTLPMIPRGDQLAVGGGFQQEPCPKSDQFKPIHSITNRIAASTGDVPVECPIDDRIETSVSRGWCQTVFTWKASGMCHKPLYFEEIALERYGHSTGPFSQPVVSMAHFFATVPTLPYQMGMDPPWECKYALGYYRPGSCAPYIVPSVPLSPQGAVVGGATAAGLILVLP